MSQLMNFGIGMENNKVEEMIVECLRERSNQSTTSVIRNVKLEKNIVSRGIARLRERGVVVTSSSMVSRNNGHSWTLAKNDNDPRHKLMTKKWDLKLFA